jgi:hypothetical protein
MTGLISYSNVNGHKNLSAFFIAAKNVYRLFHREDVTDLKRAKTVKAFANTGSFCRAEGCREARHLGGAAAGRM